MKNFLFLAGLFSGGISAIVAQTATSESHPALADTFSAFAPRVQVRSDERFLYVESTGLPEHGLMRGITNWQQQVPVPQSYTGTNAWRLPLAPIVAKEPVSIRGRFLRGAIALAANGVPIFNPQNNRGEVSAEIGELDEWGGHCGKADDYHYHAAPLHLQEKVGRGRPIAVALDGYPIYGLTEPDGTAPAGLDAIHGHTSPALGYHYHASTKYPYVNGGFHGEVTEAGGQVDPQPSAQPARGAGSPLRGAKITAFETTGKDAYKLSYEVSGEKRAVLYAVKDGKLIFEYQDGRAGTRTETYARRGEAQPAPLALEKPPASGFELRSPVVKEGGDLPKEFTGDGSGESPPLEWAGAPPGTKNFALIMHHTPGPDETKWYWTLYHLPADLKGLPRAAAGIGTTGSNSVNRQLQYAPPHSKGPGPKTYTLTLYALSDEPKPSVPAAQVTRDVLLAAIKEITLASAELHVVYTRGGETAPPAANAPDRPRNPELEALDLNHDGTIDAEEIAQAPASLRKLDRNGDGRLTPDELRPPRER